MNIVDSKVCTPQIEHLDDIVPCWRYLLGLQTTPLNISHSFYCRLHRQSYNCSVTNSSLTNCVDRSPFPSTTSVGAWLFTVDSRLSLPLLSPTTDYCLRRLAHRLSDSSPVLTGWLSRLTDSSLRNSCLKVGMYERYSRHLSQLFIYAL
jgi:hypothetical protein